MIPKDIQKTYTDREINTFMEEIKDSLKAMTNENIISHTKLDENQKLTNGKVADINKWRERMTGAAWAIGVAFTVLVIPLLTWAFISISNIPDDIERGINSTLSSYNIEINEKDD